MTTDEQLLLEQVLSAHRERGRDGEIHPSPAWHDLGDEARREAFEATVAVRDLEAALAAEGHSTSVAAVLARIRRA
jgi:hypothetical protein